MHTVNVYSTNYNLHQKKYEENLNFNNVILNINKKIIIINFIRPRLMTLQQISPIEKNALYKLR